MLAILSPARNTCPASFAGPPAARPLFGAEAQQLAGHLQGYSPWQLESLLDVPPERALAFFAAYRDFDAFAPGSPALFSFWGAAYRNMAPEDFSEEQLCFAQEHLRILSALYGMLRPMDGILNHRLGLKKEFSPGGRDLYAFWGDKICRALFQNGQLVVNLASAEYARLVTPFMQPGDKMLGCRFLLAKPGGAKGTVATVRAARGLMARYLVMNQIDRPEDLKGFDADGYRFSPGLSGRGEYVFVKQPGGGLYGREISV